jgi:hypothetical protein
MMRLSAVLVAGLILSGCGIPGSNNSVDPFFGRTRIEPPATGSVAPRTGGDAYNPTGPQPTRLQTPSVQSPAGSAAPGPTSSWTPRAESATGSLAAVQNPAKPADRTSESGPLSNRGTAAPADLASGGRIAIPLAAQRLSEPTSGDATGSSSTPALKPAVQNTNQSAGTADATSSTVASAGPPAPSVSVARRELITRTLEPRPKDASGRRSRLPGPVGWPAGNGSPAATGADNPSAITDAPQPLAPPAAPTGQAETKVKTADIQVALRVEPADVSQDAADQKMAESPAKR